MRASSKNSSEKASEKNSDPTAEPGAWRRIVRPPPQARRQLRRDPRGTILRPRVDRLAHMPTEYVDVQTGRLIDDLRHGED